MSTSPVQIQNAIGAVVVRATEDASYRSRVLQEPITVINEAGKLDLPLNTPIRFTEKQNELVVPLPAFGSDPDEIADEEILNSVSGGFTPLIAYGAVLCVISTVAAVTAVVEAANKHK